MSRFRIKDRDTVKATATCSRSGKLLATLYDSGFTTINSARSALMRKIPFYGGKLISISITNIDEETHKSFDVKVNR